MANEKNKYTLAHGTMPPALPTRFIKHVTSESKTHQSDLGEGGVVKHFPRLFKGF